MLLAEAKLLRATATSWRLALYFSADCHVFRDSCLWEEHPVQTWSMQSSEL